LSMLVFAVAARISRCKEVENSECEACGYEYILVALKKIKHWLGFVVYY